MDAQVVVFGHAAVGIKILGRTLLVAPQMPVTEAAVAILAPTFPQKGVWFNHPHSTNPPQSRLWLLRSGHLHDHEFSPRQIENFPAHSCPLFSACLQRAIVLHAPRAFELEIPCGEFAVVNEGHTLQRLEKIIYEPRLAFNALEAAALPKTLNETAIPAKFPNIIARIGLH